MFEVWYGNPNEDWDTSNEFKTEKEARNFFNDVCENPGNHGIVYGFRASFAILRNEKDETLDSWEEE